MEKTLNEYLDSVTIVKGDIKCNLTDRQKLMVISMVTRGNQIILGRRQIGTSTAVMAAVKYLVEVKDKLVGVRCASESVVTALHDICEWIDLDINRVSFIVKYEAMGECDVIIHEDFLYRRSVDRVLRYVKNHNDRTIYMAVSSVDDANALRALNIGELYDLGVPALLLFDGE